MVMTWVNSLHMVKVDASKSSSSSYTLNKKSLNGRGKFMVKVLWRKSLVLRSAVGKTHDLRSDLWWTIPLHILLGQYSEIDHIHRSSDAQCVSHLYPQVDCHTLSNEGIFMISPPQYFPGWIKRYVWVHFSKENTVEAGLGGYSLVKSTRYLIVIFFQGGIFRPNRSVFNLCGIPYRLDTLQLTQEKVKSSVAQCSTGWFKKSFLECTQPDIFGDFSIINLPSIIYQ